MTMTHDDYQHRAGACVGSGAAAKVRENENLTDEEKRSMLADKFRLWLNSHGNH